eukprot:Skav214523  [mRNA]  locus=scaffold410:243688:246119:- [translate_table: standard]
MAEPAQKKARTSRTFLFSSESVNEGHPDKICDQVSDAVPDACLTVDPKSKVACETCTKDNMVMVAGEITTEAKLDYDKVVRGVVAQIGFDSFVDDLSSVDSKGLSHKSCEVLVRINKQSPDIAHTHLHINPSGKFIIGGPQGDAGLTGRKIIIDTYGGWGAHGGGAFSGKDPTKVDRSAAYICRQMAKSVVSSGLSARCLVQLSYAIGVAKPLSLFVETYGSEKTGLDVNDITNVLKMEFDCRPGAIAQSLALREPKYQETAAYCHFGREPVTKKLESILVHILTQDLSKYKSMNTTQVDAALKASTYLTKWVD